MDPAPDGVLDVARLPSPVPTLSTVREITATDRVPRESEEAWLGSDLVTLGPRHSRLLNPVLSSRSGIR